MSLILAVNAGSSSLKISMYRRLLPDGPLEFVLMSSISNISAPPATFTFNGEHLPGSVISDHDSAFAHFLERLDAAHRKEIRYVCHRVVHGGDLSDCVIIDQESYHHIAALSDLAPLHNGASLSVIKACIEQLPNARSIAYFDTTFHRSIPPHISSYAINQSVAAQKGLKKYGFHGLSYAFILRAVAEYLGRTPSSLNLVVLHLGSGASACAIQHGQSLDTSMGLTPLSGLPGATRSGSVDPSLIFHYTNKAGKITHERRTTIDLHITEAEDILNRQSGWQALTGTTDFRLIAEGAGISSTSNIPSKSNSNKLAFDVFVDRIVGYIGSYHLKLAGQVNAMVFSGGIGERSNVLRQVIGEKVKCLGYVGVDPERNEKLGEGIVVDIGREERPTRTTGRILVCRTDEQLEMARACASDGELWR